MRNPDDRQPWWLKLVAGGSAGVLATFLLFWILGAFPWMPSPIWAQVTGAIDKHDRVSIELLRVQRLMCAALYDGNTAMQSECWRVAAP